MTADGQWCSAEFLSISGYFLIFLHLAKHHSSKCILKRSKVPSLDKAHLLLQWNPPHSETFYNPLPHLVLSHHCGGDRFYGRRSHVDITRTSLIQRRLLLEDSSCFLWSWHLSMLDTCFVAKSGSCWALGTDYSSPPLPQLQPLRGHPSCAVTVRGKIFKRKTLQLFTCSYFSWIVNCTSKEARNRDCFQRTMMEERETLEEFWLQAPSTWSEYEKSFSSYWGLIWWDISQLSSKVF